MPERLYSVLGNFLNYFQAVTMAKVYFILMKDNNKAERKTKTGLKSKLEQTSVLKGSLWSLDAKEFQEMYRLSRATLRSAESKDLSLTCELQDITKLTELEFRLLLALTTCKERDALHSDNRQLREAISLHDTWKEAVESRRDLPRVQVQDERSTRGNVITGTLKYTGSIPGRSGLWFGVEIDMQFCGLDISNTDGVFENRVVFDCAPRSGILVTGNKICPLERNGCSPAARKDRSSQLVMGEPSLADKRTPSPSQASSSSSNIQDASGTRNNQLPHPDVELGDRVVWYDEKNAIQLATVRWIGVLKEKPHEFTIGVENDKPVGNGTGMHNNEQLFITQLNHASLIPAAGLLKAEVVYGSKDLVPPPPNSGQDAFMPTGARTPLWDDRVPWEAYLNQQAYQHQPYLHSQSDSGVLGQTSKANLSDRAPLSASHDLIPLHSQSTRNQFDRNTVKKNSLSSSLQFQFDNRKHTVRRDLLKEEYHQVCDVTDVRQPQDFRDADKGTAAEHEGQRTKDDFASNTGNSQISPVPLGSTQVVPRSAAPVSSSSSGLVDLPFPPYRDRSSTAPIAGASDNRDTSSPVLAAKTGSTTDTFVPRSLSSRELNTDLDIGSMVEVDIPGLNAFQYGVIRWIGLLKEGNKAFVGVELEEENMACTDGTFNNVRLFMCAPKKGFFTQLSRVRLDKRFAESSHFMRRSDSTAFGSLECDEIPGVHVYRVFETKDELEEFFQARRTSSQRNDFPGRNLGIQGHHNSCYLDSTLFSMFAFSSAFDSILHRQRAPGDIRQYGEIQRALRDGVVNPLRCHMFVRADKVLHLRYWLSQCSSIQGLLDEEKDPDEFFISLLQDTLRVEPFIKFSSGQSGFCYQLFVEKDEKIQLPTTQQLLTLSLFQSDIKLLEVPRCLILQMPRFGKDFQMYKRIIPSLTLDITNMLEHDPQPCCFCGKLASSECRDCFLEFGKGCDRAFFCKTCIKMSHSSTMRVGHKPKDLDVYPESVDFYNRPDAPEIRSEVLELFAVICIKTSHYVTFTKCGSNPNAPWVFFDSMADRIGQQHGHNIPQLEICPELPEFLKEENHVQIMKSADDKNLPERMRRLLCDGYVCLYQSLSLEPYR